MASARAVPCSTDDARRASSAEQGTPTTGQPALPGLSGCCAWLPWVPPPSWHLPARDCHQSPPPLSQTCLDVRGNDSGSRALSPLHPPSIPRARAEREGERERARARARAHAHEHTRARTRHTTRHRGLRARDQRYGALQARDQANRSPIPARTPTMAIEVRDQAMEGGEAHAHARHTHARSLARKQ